MFYNNLPDFSPVMVTKIEYLFEATKIIPDGFMNKLNFDVVVQVAKYYLNNLKNFLYLCLNLGMGLRYVKRDLM